ncbi:hypothetical protein [Geoalkalibacter subterraneus]|uniref:hypothetical protein n=1 Tax=Geoalkalibacter subterraneus TaxID=483547 RepID=UPI000693B422|nr:hypothetical protein [Geoalkalibacter subterraneus]
MGVCQGHAWVEFEDAGIIWCRDVSNGHDACLPQGLYYAAGQIRDEPQKLVRYRIGEAILCMTEYGHYGPWDLEVNL